MMAMKTTYPMFEIVKDPTKISISHRVRVTNGNNDGKCDAHPKNAVDRLLHVELYIFSARGGCCFIYQNRVVKLNRV